MEGVNPWIGLAVTAVPILFSIVSAAFPDWKLGRYTKIINALALNFGNARNDPKQATKE